MEVNNKKADSKKSADTKRKLLKLNFWKKRKEFEQFSNDDRRVFCNVYDMLMESLEVMESVENNYIWVAFNKKFRIDFEELKEIDSRFSK